MERTPPTVSTSKEIEEDDRQELRTTLDKDDHKWST